MNKLNSLKNLEAYLTKVITRLSRVYNRDYIPVEEVLQELNKHPLWEFMDEEKLVHTISSGVMRTFQVSNGKIRSNRKNIVENPLKTSMVMPPKYLYFATSPGSINKIKSAGITPPQGEMFVTLFSDRKYINVLNPSPFKRLILQIDSYNAMQQGVKFFRSQFNSYNARFIPAKYIKEITSA